MNGRGSLDVFELFLTLLVNFQETGKQFVRLLKKSKTLAIFKFSNFIFRICWDCVSRNAARTTRPLLRPTSCMLSDNTLDFYARIGNSSKLLSTNYSSSCTKLTTEFRTGLDFFFIYLSSNASGWSQ